MATANQELFDITLRHGIGVRRLAGAEVTRVLKLLGQSDAELEEKLRKRLGNVTFGTKRFKVLMADIKKLRTGILNEIQATSRDELIALAKAEQEFSKKIVQQALPVELEFAAAKPELLRALVVAQPFAGGTNAARTLDQWFKSLAAVDQQRITEAIQLGMVQGEAVNQIVGRVRNVAELSRTNAEAVVRTAVNHVSNASREAFFNANKEVVAALRWTATLDGRTSAICRARDGHHAPIDNGEGNVVPDPKLVPPTARPPAHPNCRSLMIAVLDQDGIAAAIPDRPFVRDARTRRMREMDFRANAREAVGNRWRGMSAKQRNSSIRRIKQEWARENIGTITGDITYDEWLRKQPTSFQNEVLGVRKAQAFRKGLRLDKFIDRAGNELTLDELNSRFPDFVTSPK